ncbi:MAG: N-acetylmuramoyl-L-alanine amidase [Clostridium sp.]|nr:N-acetylmuramoyl-L-alanine amidase [Clostridium sp.]
MPKIFLSPSTQEWNQYVTGGNEEEYMNLLADRMEPYLRSSGISYVRNDPARNVTGAISDSNSAYYDVHLALHSNAAPERLSGQLRGIDIYFSPQSYDSERLANIIANNLKIIYPLPDKSRAVPTTSLGEVTQTKAVAVLCELGYHDNAEDVTWLKNNLEAIAKNLVNSLCDYFGIPFVNAGPVMNGVVSAGGSNLNIRSYPSTGGKIVGSVPDGARVAVNGNVGNGWYVISYNGITGYANGQFIVIS